MKERVSRRKEGKSPSSVQCVFNAIAVGSGRHAEPYIIAFHYKSDNVAGKPLGTLFGFFEMEIHDEDAAYIVNFLASVAKKEYFTNPRREVSDSFETTLHKVNVALAEIAKEGNVSWLGHLHGILGAIADNTVHFSATGDGVLALVREQTLRPISDGLAEVSTEPHPLKTFTEVSSGKLIESDVLLALSPAVWTLFTPEDLKKNLARLGQKGFEQFLHTALINELPIAGAVVINVSAAPITTPTPKQTKEALGEETEATKLLNVWSGQTFEKARSSRLKAFTSPPPTTPPKEHQQEYIDKKTGHIYVHGEEEAEQEEEPWKTRLTLWSHSLSQSWQLSREKLRRFGRRSRKNIAFFISGVEDQMASSGRKGLRRIRSSLRHIRKIRETRKSSAITLPVPPTEATTTTSASSLPSFSLKENLKDNWKKVTLPRLPKPSISFPFDTFVAWIGQTKQVLIQVNHSTLRYIQAAWQRSLIFWQDQSKRTRQIMAGSGVVLVTIGLGTWFYLNRSPVWEQPAVVVPSLSDTVAPLTPSSITSENEPLAVRLSESRVISSFNGEPIALSLINNTPFDIRSERIVNLKTSESTALPEPIRLATAMDDLDALFLLGQSGTLYIFTVANKKFEQNTLPLPGNTQIDALGTYLTYLYVLDRKAGTLYRFPRVEGGFGAPTRWSKETLTIHPISPLSIFENVAIVLPDGHPALYSSGRKTEAAFAGTQTPLETKALTIDPKNGDVYALDPKEKRIVRWSSTGTLIAQYFHNSLSDARTINVTRNNELLIARPSGTFSFQLP